MKRERPKSWGPKQRLLKGIGLLYLLCALSACSVSSNKKISQGALQINLVDVHGQPIRKARVFRIGEDGKRYRAQKKKRSARYYFPPNDFDGTLYLKHPRFQNETYDISSLHLQFLFSPVSFSLFLRKKRHGVYTQGGIRYPYIRQANRIAIMRHDTAVYQGQAYQRDIIQHLLDLGAVSGHIHREKKKRIFIGKFLAQIMYLPEALGAEERKMISDYLFSVDHLVHSGPLLGTETMLFRELEVRLRTPEDRAKALSVFEAEALSIISETPHFGNPVPGYFRLRVPALETEKIIEVRDRLNAMDLFYPLSLGQRPIFWADL